MRSATPTAVLLLLTSLFLSCHSSKRAGSDAMSLVERSQRYVMRALAGNQVNSPIFNAKAKIKYDDGEQRLSFVSNLRMQQDSFIWVTASILGFEGARILIRPDSIFAINRLEKSFVAESYDEFDREFEIPVSFGQLQDLLLGNMLLDPARPYTFEYSQDHYRLHQNGDRIGTAHWIDAKHFAPRKIKAEDSHSGYSIDADFSKHQALGKSVIFSYIREYIIKKDNTHFATIQLNFTDIDTEERKETPFRIPSHYTRAD